MKSSGFKEKLGKTFNREKILRFLDKQGFYIVLFICVGIIGATAVWTSMAGKAPKEEAPIELSEKDLEEDEGKTVQSTPDVGKVDVQDKAGTQDPKKDEKKDPKTTPTKDKDNAKPTSASAEEKSSKVPTLIKPSAGDVLTDFADNSLIYSKTLEQWTTHPAIDIKGKEGTEVKAVLGGTIEKAAKDAEMGNVIVIDHGNGLKSKYASLSTLDMVKAGQKVDRGQTISGVGKTAVFESSDEAHLHFEVILNNKNVDPKKYWMD